MLIDNAQFLELCRKLGFVNFLEEILEATIIIFEDRVLRRQIYGPFAGHAIVQRGTGKVANGIVEIVHRQRNAGRGVTEYFFVNFLPIIAIPNETQRSGAGDQEISRAILVTKRMTANHDGVRPARDQAGYVINNDWLAENYTAQNIADGTVGRLPHFLQAEFFDARFVWCNCGAFYTDAEFADGVGGINGDLIIGLVAIFHAKVIIFQVDIKIWQNESFTNPFPDDPCHFVAIKLDNGVFDLNFCHVTKHFPLGRWVDERCHSKVYHLFNCIPNIV